MRLRHYVFAIGLVASSVVIACSDDDVAGSASSSGAGSSSSGASGGASSGSRPGTSSSSSGAPGDIDLDSIVSLTITSDYCMKPQGQCYDAQSFTVDFMSAKLTNATCVEIGPAPDAGGTGGTQDGKTSHALTAANLELVKQRLAELRTAGPSPALDGGNGLTQRTLEVTTKSQGTRFYITEDTTCPRQPQSLALRQGWQELWDTLRGM